jgi:hypothetical protein
MPDRKLMQRQGIVWRRIQGIKLPWPFALPLGRGAMGRPIPFLIEDHQMDAVLLVRAIFNLFSK